MEGIGQKPHRDFSALKETALSYHKKGFFPRCEWAVFDRSGILTADALDGEGGFWFDIASLTKLFTSTAILRLAGEHSIPLIARAAGLLRLISTAPLYPHLQKISLFSLLTHTSGIPAWFPFYADGRSFEQVLLRVLTEIPRAEGMCYSDINFMILRYIICSLTQEGFESAIKKYALDPEGITEASFTPDLSLPIAESGYDNAEEEAMCRERGLYFERFRPHNTPIRGSVHDGNAHYYFNGVSGHAGLFATVRALARLGIFYLNTAEPLLMRALKPEADCGGRSLGFHSGFPFPRGVGHTGFTGTSLWIDAEHGVGLAILTNRLFYPIKTGTNLGEFRSAMHCALADIW